MGGLSSSAGSEWGRPAKVTLLRFGGRVGYAIRLAFTSLRSYSSGLMLPSVEWRRVGLLCRDWLRSATNLRNRIAVRHSLSIGCVPRSVEKEQRTSTPSGQTIVGPRPFARSQTQTLSC